MKTDTLCAVQPVPDAHAFSLGPPRAKAGVLCVHGFTGTPFEMRLLGEHLAGRGFAVEGPCLAGHAGTTADLRATRWPDWLFSVEQGLDRLRARADKVAVCGLSLGGLLTLEVARRRKSQVEAICCLSTALWLPPNALMFDRLIQRTPLRKLALPKLAGSDIRDPELRALNKIAQGRAGMPLEALHSLIEFGEYLKPRVHEITQPTLLVHARKDHTVPFACMDYLAKNLGSREIVEVPLERSFHVITLDVDREQVFRAVEEHVTNHLGGA